MTQEKLIAKYGNPMAGQIQRELFERDHMMLLKYPQDIADKIPAIGKSIYCNKDFGAIYIKFLRLLIERGLHKEINANDQCFMPRYQRGSSTAISVHSWGMAVDLNPNDNPLGLDRNQAIIKGLKPFTAEFQQAVRDAGLIAGYDFVGRPDGMHIENTKDL